MIISKECIKEITALKNVTINEPFFNGHFPEHPVMPGVLIMEALAQAAGVLELSRPENKGKLVGAFEADNEQKKPQTEINNIVDEQKIQNALAKLNNISNE